MIRILSVAQSDTHWQPLDNLDEVGSVVRMRSCSLAMQGACEFCRSDDGCLLRDDDVEQQRVHLCIWVGAAIADDATTR